MINIILTDLVPLRERGKYMAIVQMVSAVGAALGPFLGGLLTERSSWRWVFYINLPIGGSKSYHTKEHSCLASVEVSRRRMG